MPFFEKAAHRQHDPLRLIAELHRRQAEMYAGGGLDPVAELLAEEIIWHVPGASAIAGDHRGREQVIAYFENRRRLAHETMRMVPGELLVQGDAVAQFIEGSAELGGRVLTWQTLGAYRTDPAAGLVREVWLVPLDGDLFDRIWSAADPSEPESGG